MTADSIAAVLQVNTHPRGLRTGTWLVQWPGFNVKHALANVLLLLQIA